MARNRDTFVCRLDRLEEAAHEARVAILAEQLFNNDAVERQRERERRCVGAGGHAFAGLLNGNTTYRCSLCGKTTQKDGSYLEFMSVPEWVDDPDARDERRPRMWAGVAVAEPNRRSEHP